MPAASRLVEHAHVHAGSADDGPRWRFLLEDALRTAEFGDAGRLIVVRRLRLTGLPARPGPGQAARALESAWAAQVRQAVPALAPGAAAAPVVWFGSRLQAQAEWLAAWADDDRPRLAHWYWPAALQMPAARSAVITPAVAVQVWRAAQAASPAPWRRQVAAWPDVRVVALARRWAAAGVLPVPAPSPVPVDDATDVVAGEMPDRASAPASARCLQVAARIARHAPLPVEAQRWLAAHWLVETGGSSVPPDVRMLRSIVALVPRIVAGPAPIPAGGRAAAPDGSGPAAVARPAAHSVPRPLRRPSIEPIRRQAAALEPTWHALPAPTVNLDAPGLAPHHPALVRLAAARPWLADGDATGHGGLLFLLNLLPALGFPAWLKMQPDAAAFVDRLFLHLLDATGAPPDDPQRAWFDPAAAADDPRLRRWRLRLRRWRLRLRRALRRRARLDLGELVRRPALVTATPTHLDLIFPLDEVDLRLRRLGLDLDPGWLPWFGRIVSFHFL